MQPTFSKTQTLLIIQLMGSLTPSNAIYWEMLEKAVADTIEKGLNHKILLTNAGLASLREIESKVKNYLADLEIEKILAMEDENPITSYVKILSYQQSKQTAQQVQAKIYSAVSISDVPLSRKEISERTDLRLSSVCGRVNEMILKGTLKVSGTKWDKDSQREVQTLEVSNDK